jgi:hypothetical protein
MGPYTPPVKNVRPPGRQPDRSPDSDLLEGTLGPGRISGRTSRQPGTSRARLCACVDIRSTVKHENKPMKTRKKAIDTTRLRTEWAPRINQCDRAQRANYEND